MKHPRGVEHWNARTTEEDVRLIRILYQEGLTKAEIAEKFELNWATVHDILRFRTWKHVL